MEIEIKLGPLAPEQARAAKEILLNELGVIYHKPDAGSRPAASMEASSA